MALGSGVGCRVWSYFGLSRFMGRVCRDRAGLGAVFFR